MSAKITHINPNKRPSSLPEPHPALLYSVGRAAQISCMCIHDFEWLCSEGKVRTIELRGVRFVPGPEIILLLNERAAAEVLS